MKIKLWESANQTWNDKETNFVFDTRKVGKASFEQVQKALIKCNYWLYVLYQYTDIRFKNIEELTPMWLWSRNGFKELE